ncbi:hypothetical protein GFS60_07789 (plasmid) [Rhodococcus sp. WAY2]|nr:hypothetical protein GFS60_07789 [Rhodococcus sp. WAY2]
MTPSAEHAVTAARAPYFTRRQARLDADRIDLYRDHWVAFALGTAPPQNLPGCRRGCRALISCSSH